MTAPLNTCEYCGRIHSPTFLCPTARGVLDALKAKGTKFDMPTMEFAEPMTAGLTGTALDYADVLARQITVAAAVVPIEDGPALPAIILSGHSGTGPLQRWLYAGGAGELRRVSRLVNDMVELAIRRSR